jgi:molybdopterin-binding protein
MKISARNALSGKIKDVKKGAVAAEVVVDIGGGHTVTATITVGSVERLGLKPGMSATAVIKASDVMIAVPD